MEVAIIVFPKPYLCSKAVYYLKFNKLKYGLMYFHEDYTIFYQDKKYIPKLDGESTFNRIVDRIVDDDWLKDMKISYVKFTRDDFVEDYVSIYYCGVSPPPDD